MNSDFYKMEFPLEMGYSVYDANKQTPGGPIAGGVDMSRTQSGASNESWDCVDSAITSFSGNRIFNSGSPAYMAGMDRYPQYEGIKPDPLKLNSYYPQQQYNSSSGVFQQTDNLGPTPSSLGWAKDTELLKLYTLKVPRGKLPYLQLQEKWTPTYETPAKVYLDEAKGFQKNQFPCMYPGECNSKQTIFSRPADLERHYKNVHGTGDEFPCDYPKCARLKDPFHRKDHFRDHLRDFHKEDIGCAKGNPKDKQKWKQAQMKWLAERVITPKHWRCSRCLVKNYVAEVGWECSSCKTPCEEDRTRIRLEAGQPAGVMQDSEVAEPNAYYCSTCNGSSWIREGGGAAWVACPMCSASHSYSIEEV